MLFSRFTQSAAALALLTIGFAAPACAQNNKQVISGTWFEDRASNSVNAQNLYLTFAQAPTDKFLNITRVSCAITATSNMVMLDVMVSGGTAPNQASDVNRPQYLAVNLPVESFSTQKYYTLNQQTYLKLGPGRYPSVSINAVVTTSGAININASCAIVGDLSDD
jgi:hypothetical protein